MRATKDRQRPRLHARPRSTPSSAGTDTAGALHARRPHRVAMAVVLALAMMLTACQGADDSTENGVTDEPEGADEGATESVAGGDSDEEGDGVASDDDASSAPSGHSLRMGAFNADVNTLNPHGASSTPDRVVVDLVFNGLVRYKPGDSRELEPDLAVDVPEPQEDGGQQVWRFELREGVLCQPGPQTDSYELTSEDVVYSLNRAADPDRSTYAAAYEGYSFETDGDYGVVVTLDQPRSSTLFLASVANLAGGFIVCQQAVEAMGDEEFDRNPVGTGPFMFSQYVPQSHIELTAFEDYWRGVPELPGVEIQYMPDDASRRAALLAGDVDVIHGFWTTSILEELDGTDGIQAGTLGVGEGNWLFFNVNRPPFDDIRVRQAVAYGTNREDFAAIYGGEPVATVMCSFIGPFFPGSVSCEDAEELGLAYNYDPDRARELLEEAGLSDGFEMDLVTSDLNVYRDVYEVLTAQLSQFNITVNLQITDNPTMHDQIREAANPITSYLAPGPTTNQLLTRFAHSDSAVVVGSAPNANFSQYDGADDLIEAARNEPDPERQKELWREANIKILEDMAIHSQFFVNNQYAASDCLDFGHELVQQANTYFGITDETRLTC